MLQPLEGISDPVCSQQWPMSLHVRQQLVCLFTFTKKRNMFQQCFVGGSSKGEERKGVWILGKSTLAALELTRGQLQKPHDPNCHSPGMLPPRDLDTHQNLRCDHTVFPARTQLSTGAREKPKLFPCQEK